MGSHGPSESYSVPSEALKVLSAGIFNNSKISKHFPVDLADLRDSIKITGSSLPIIPVSWRFGESAAALKAFEGCLVGAIVKQKYGVNVSQLEVNAEHATLLILSTLLNTVNPETDQAFRGSFDGPDVARLDDIIPNYDFGQHASSPYRVNTASMYPTKDGKFFHLHGDLNPDITLKSLEMPLDSESKTLAEAYAPFLEKVSQYTAKELDHIASQVTRRSGCVSQTREAFLQSEHGKANEHVNLFEIFKISNRVQLPCWWPDASHTSSSRPLAGLKVVDLTRVIAAPVATRGLAEWGASIMRITSPNISDYSCVHLELNWGKWNTSLDLHDEGARETVRGLIMEADVVIQGYRPGVLDKFGFSQQAIIDMAQHRSRGIISVRENCYGWYGPLRDRIGWQEISDANVGISSRYGRALGLENDEPVTPVFPNSDWMTGVSGTIAILAALLRRAKEGGSYKVDFALNYYNQWLAECVGEYPDDVWNGLRERHGNPHFRCYHNVNYTIPIVLKEMERNSEKLLNNAEFDEDRESKAVGVIIRTLKPAITFPNHEVRPGFNIGTRGNGRDQPRWPEDLLTEVVV